MAAVILGHKAVSEEPETAFLDPAAVAVGIRAAPVHGRILGAQPVSLDACPRVLSDRPQKKPINARPRMDAPEACGLLRQGNVDDGVQGDYRVERAPGAKAQLVMSAQRDLAAGTLARARAIWIGEMSTPVTAMPVSARRRLIGIPFPQQRSGAGAPVGRTSIGSTRRPR